MRIEECSKLQTRKLHACRELWKAAMLVDDRVGQPRSSRRRVLVTSAATVVVAVENPRLELELGKRRRQGRVGKTMHDRLWLAYCT